MSVIKVTRWGFSGLVIPKFEQNYITDFWKIVTRAALIKVCHDQGYNEIGVVIAITYYTTGHPHNLFV